MSLVRGGFADPIFDSSMTRMGSSDFPMMKSGMSCDLTESKDRNAYVAHFDTPGVPKENIHISVEDDVLTVSADFKTERHNNDDKIHWQERSSGHISRSIKLPENTAIESISASQTDGVLELVIPKTNPESKKTHSIKIA